VVAWVKRNKLAVLLLVLIGFYLIRGFVGNVFTVKTYQYGGGSAGLSNPTFGTMEAVSPMAAVSNTAAGLLSSGKLPSDTSSKATGERMVVQNSNLSLVVKDVVGAGNEVVAYAERQGGFMVSTSYNRPTESPFATITVRVPTERFKATLDYYRALAVKVTNENLVGTDVTEQYTDIEERLETHERTKAKFEEILNMATDIDDILRVNRELINVQTQIDALKGQKEALEKNAALTKITVYLSTDELSLPYTPDNKFRPKVVFKLATRSLLNSLRLIGEGLIWLIVYVVIWVPVVIVVWLVRRWRRKRIKVV